MRAALWSPLVLLSLGCDGGDSKPDDDSSTDDEVTACEDPAQNPFAGTCVETFLAGCFDPSGDCTYAQQGANVILTWENGATVETAAGRTTTTTLTASDGTVCATGTTVVGAGDCFAQTTYVRASDSAEQVWCTYQDGSFDVQCPDGSTVSVTAEESSSANSCQYGGGTCEAAP